MIKFDQVNKSFNDHQKQAIVDMTFTINDGEFVFVTGHSGSGKTTLLKLLLKEYLPDNGEITFDEENLNTLAGHKIAELRRKIGVVFQDYQLLDDLTVWENIALPLVLAKKPTEEINTRISELLQLLELTGYEEMFPVQLSGGEAQRISLARALAMGPKLIFADEPTGNLDYDNTQKIINLLQTVNGYGTTIILATHDLSLLDKIPGARRLELDHGHLVKDTKATTNSSTTKNDANQKSAAPTYAQESYVVPPANQSPKVEVTQPLVTDETPVQKTKRPSLLSKLKKKKTSTAEEVNND